MKRWQFYQGSNSRSVQVSLLGTVTIIIIIIIRTNRDSEIPEML
jgi:hypothetical protein